MSAISEYFFNSRSDVSQLEMIEVTHPNFTKTYRICRNAPYYEPVTVDLSPDERGVTFDWYPLGVEHKGAQADLDYAIQFNLGDLGEEIPDQLDAVTAANGFKIKPQLRYWAFRSDMLDQPMIGPIRLEIPSITLTEEGSSFEARAQTLNQIKTGIRYTLVDYPPLRGFL